MNLGQKPGRIIGTGFSGLVGSRIVELLSKKFQFIDFSLATSVDITDFNLLKKRFLENKEAPVVIHLAAFTDVNAAFDQNGDQNGSCFRVNVLGTRNIAKLCAQTKKYLIHISTDFVFDGKNPPKKGYTEKDTPKPIEWYGMTKYLAELEVEQSGCNYVIFRIAFPFKAKPSPQKLEPNVKLDLARKIKKRLENSENLHMFSDQIITPTFIDDIAASILRCIEVRTVGPACRQAGIYHCTGSSWHSPFGIAIKVAEKFNLDKSLIKKASLEEFRQKNPNSRQRQKSLPMSNKKLEKDLGVKMLSFDEALGKI